MKILEELLLEDFVLLFFECNSDLNDSFWRDLTLKNWNLMDAFPKNEICEKAREVYIISKCRNYVTWDYELTNYIKD